MALKIKDGSSEEVKITQIKMLIYGPAGVGKTSLAFTAKNPLLLDFDEGSHRAGNRTKFVEIKNWKDVAGMTANDLKDFDTIIVDTAGQMLSVMTRHLIENNKSAVKKSSSELSVQGYGILKSMFDTFTSKLIGMRKDIIFIAHDKEHKVEEQVIIRPDIIGGSYQIIKRSMDLIGYLDVSETGNKELNFNPTAQTIGKNCANFKTLVIPNHINQEFDTFLEDQIAQTKKYINVQAKEGKNFYEYRRKIASLELAEEFDTLANEMQNETADLKSQLRNLIGERIRTLGIIYDKAIGKFIQIQPETSNSEE